MTGASGFIGRNCLDGLVAKGYEVFGAYATRRPPDRAGVTWCNIDLLRESAASLIASVKPSHLLHLAWYVEPGTAMTHPDNFRWVIASLELLREFRQHGGARCLIAGSCFEYDCRYGYCSEALTPKVADTFYGSTKNSVREAFLGYCRTTGLSGAWARIFYLYGPHENDRRLVPTVIRSVLTGEPALCSHGEQIRDYLHVSDAASTLVNLLDSDFQGECNVGSGEAVPLKDIITRIGALTGRSELIRLGAIPARPSDVPFIVADITRLKQMPFWKPGRALDAGLEDTIGWWRERLGCAAAERPS